MADLEKSRKYRIIEYENGTFVAEYSDGIIVDKKEQWNALGNLVDSLNPFIPVWIVQQSTRKKAEETIAQDKQLHAIWLKGQTIKKIHEII